MSWKRLGHQKQKEQEQKKVLIRTNRGKIQTKENIKEQPDYSDDVNKILFAE